MPLVCSVKFPYAARDLWFDANGLDPQRGQSVICETERGREYGVVSGASREVDEETLESVTGGSTLKPVIRIATAEDDDYADELEGLAGEAMAEFQQQVRELGLDMKPVGVEYLFGGEGVVCYFIADNRVDFRQLARNLSRTLHARVDLRQIGVREQASIMGGLAHCGQEYCCSRLGQGFGPVTIRMAKDQDLPLNSPKISGACGRLMCCLRYEDAAYKDFKKRAPRKNATVETPFGPAKVSEFDTPREAVGLRLEGNRTIRVPLESMECSEAARARSERDGVPCRPDCVTLAALERLESPQVKLALAQLRAETELTEGDWMPKEDLLPVEGEPSQPSERPRRRRRRRNGAEEAPEGSRPEGEAPRGRRRRRAKTDGTAKAPAEVGTETPGEGRSGQEPRRDGATSRRRHHGQGSNQGRQQRRPRQRTDLGQKSKRGNATQEARTPADAEAQTRQSPQPKRQRTPKKRTGQSQRPPKAQTAPKSAGDSAAQKPSEDRKPGRARRRRRRHSGGSGNAGGSNQTAS